MDNFPTANQTKSAEHEDLRSKVIDALKVKGRAYIRSNKYSQDVIDLVTAEARSCGYHIYLETGVMSQQSLTVIRR